jgi:hypothetical protein
MTKTRLNWILLFASLSLYALNNYLLKGLDIPGLDVFLVSYFNDVLAGVLILSYTNLLLHLVKRVMSKLLTIFAFILCCSFVWEFVAPYFKAGAVFDWFDFVAYQLGGLLYWTLFRVYRLGHPLT